MHLRVQGQDGFGALGGAVSRQEQPGEGEQEACLFHGFGCFCVVYRRSLFGAVVFPNGLGGTGTGLCAVKIGGGLQKSVLIDLLIFEMPVGSSVVPVELDVSLWSTGQVAAGKMAYQVFRYAQNYLSVVEVLSVAKNLMESLSNRACPVDRRETFELLKLKRWVEQTNCCSLNYQSSFGNGSNFFEKWAFTTASSVERSEETVRSMTEAVA